MEFQQIDLIGRTQGEALYTRVALEREKGPLLAVWPVNHTKEKHSPSAWRMSHAIPSWSWHGCEGKPAMVEVYARAAKVALKINGKTVGEAAPKNDCVVRFSCTYEDGTVEAVSYDTAGNEIGRTALHIANTETRLCLVPEEETVRPGGLAFVQLRYTDENGTVKSLERGTVTVKVRGGTLLGLGSACAYSERGYLSDTTDTYFGEALAVVRADADADTVELTAADGTHNAACCIPVVGFNMGAKKPTRVKELFTKLLLAEATVGAVALVLVELLPRQLIALFGAANESVYYTDFAVKSFRIYLCMIILACVNKACFIFLQAMGKAAESTALSMVREVVFGVGFALLLPRFFGLDGVLYSMPMSDILTFLIAGYLICKTYRELSTKGEV